MELTVILIFSFVYFGMFLGEIPGLALDRTGVALLGAILVILCGDASPEQAWNAIDVPTIALLFGLMIVSAQFRLGGFYVAVTRKLASLCLSPEWILFWLIGVAGILSAFLANDIVCLAMSPILIEGCVKRRLNPMPFLLALACAANVGSAATLIGNPQNMLIGQRLHLPFGGYFLDSLVPAFLGLFVVWGVIVFLYRQRWQRDPVILKEEEVSHLNRWQSGKGMIVLILILIAFLFSSWPREVVALGAAGLLLTSRHMASRKMLGLVDWQILVLFMGLFIVNHALEQSGLLEKGMQWLFHTGINLQQPAWLFTMTVILSNIVSNVPATMLLLPAATHPFAGSILAISSTLAGNLILVGSIANLIVADQAAQWGILIRWKEHAKVGIPVTLLTLLISAGWLWFRVWITGI